MAYVKPMPPIGELLELFYYDDGLRWKQRLSRGRGGIVNPGDLVRPSWHSTGYAVFTLQNGLHKFHRIVWAVYHQSDPYPFIVDHIDRNRRNNAVENLRIATRGQNSANSARNRTKTPYRGVMRTYARRERWKGYINKGGKRIYTPPFDTPEEAFAARNALAAELHGNFMSLL